MKVPSNYNYDFKVRDYQSTKMKHLGKIKRMKEYYNVNYNDIIDDRFLYDLMDVIISKPNFYQWLRPRVIDKGYLSKTDLRELKTIINSAVKTAIQGSLRFNNIPESYDTAFYIDNYSKINNIMKQMTKEIIRDCI